ncbi:MAG: CehA/McbA family metallohydrolase [Deltaproteobacteria bacterium]|nr:CehA/McbA family metallohydrolase [Deltaproteobacteria bacterium]
MRRSFLPFFVAFLAACPKPTDGDPQIPVTPGAAARINLVGSRAGKTVKSTDGTERAARARAHTMDASPASRLGGPNATGRPGDWVLENDEVVFVIDSLAGGGGFAESGGNLVDAADARLRKDELGQLFTYFGVFPRQALYGSMTGREEPDGTAVVEVKGRELWEPSIEVTTEYRLSGADRALLLRTTLKNTGAQPLALPGVGDAIVWGGTEKVAPGKGVGFKGTSTGPYIGGIGRYTSYAITSTEGEISAISGTAWTDTEQRKNVPLPVGESVTYERVFVVGERGDLASIVGELTKASGGDLGAVSIKVVDANGAPASVSADAKLVVSTPVVNGKGGEDVMSLVAGKPGDAIEGELPPGRWVLTYAPSAGRRGVAGDKGKIIVDVKKGAVAKGTVAVTDIATLTVGCSEKDPTSGVVRPLPCKVILEGIDGTSTPDLGPAHVATVARNQIFAVTAPSLQAVPPGKYRLTFSRGPEYAVETAEIALGVGGAASTAAVQKTLSRVVDTSGYVSTDFHQHTSASADSGVAAQDRVLGNVAEAVEVAVVSEHNVVADFTSIAKDLGLTKYVVHVPGDEVTSDSNRKPWGHVNVFPLEVDATKARMGAVPVRDRSPSEVFKDVRALPSPRVIQVNHPRSGSNGYFDLLGFDPKTATATGQGYAADFDALEVWNGRNVEARAKVLDDFMALLRTGHPVTAIADTDTHGVVGHEAGLPRTYVRVSKDDALESWDAARSADLVASVRERRDVVLTNGPFIQVSANGAGIGGVARGPNVDVKVKVTSASFAKVERVDIRFAGSATVAGATSLVMLPKKNAAGAYEAEATFRVRAATDDAFVITASGSLPMRPMFGGDDKEITPWAMTGAVWIDADGDGKSLGRATPRR